ncbi:HNH endonuclease [Halostella pelagica]|uniref:HNH endonuclease n=1 Tax=Halostella pelagica TaxID=2583824 RepID=UPI001386E24B|nr:HNH endonuclease signature motif containing protein [Halostella pelagica]
MSMTTGAYSGERWRLARKSALARDNRRCQDCGSSEDLHVHHVTPVREFDNQTDAHYVDNLVTLCKYCHPTWEGRSDRPRLADGADGVLISDVVQELTWDTVDRLFRQLSPVDIYDHHIHRNGRVCSNCHARMNDASVCPDCSSPNGWAPDDTLSRREMLSRARPLVERLREQGIAVDAEVVRHTVRKLKSRSDLQGLDSEIFARAVKLGVRHA